MGFAPDGKTLWTLSGPSAAGLGGIGAGSDPATGRNRNVFQPPPAPSGARHRPEEGYTRLWFPAGSKYLVTVRGKETVFLDPDNGNEVRVLRFTTHAAESTPDGVRLFAIPKDGTTVEVYDEVGQAGTKPHTHGPSRVDRFRFLRTRAGRSWQEVGGSNLGPDKRRGTRRRRRA